MSALFSALLPILLLAGCPADLRDGVGPHVPIPNVAGLMMRAGEAAVGLDVTLRTAAGAQEVDAAVSDDDGEFQFSDVTPGEWEIKISGDRNEDFASLTLEFALFAVDERILLPELDIHNWGAQVSAPAPAAHRPAPNPFKTIAFLWTLPDRALEWARVQLYDAASRPVWFSHREITDQVIWNGLGSEGDYNAKQVQAGTYKWRLKLGFPNGAEGRTDYRDLILE